MAVNRKFSKTNNLLILQGFKESK